MNAGNKKIYIFVYLCIVGMVLVVYIYFFSKIPKISFQHFFIMNNTPGNAQRQGAEPRRASTLNAIFNPKPHSHSKHSKFCNQNWIKRLFYSVLMDGSGCKRTVPLQPQTKRTVPL